MALNADVSFTWVGHGTWKVRSARRKEILIDPWVMNNPAAPPKLRSIERCDLMLITHGHFDPMGDFSGRGPAGAAKAVSLRGGKPGVRIHSAAFPPLTGRPSHLQELVGPGVEVLDIKPGDSV